MDKLNWHDMPAEQAPPPRTKAHCGTTEGPRIFIGAPSQPVTNFFWL